MKRLATLLGGMEPNTCTYTEMYEGNVMVVPPTGGSWVDYDNRYYKGQIGFEITATHKYAQDKPTVTVMIPAEELLNDETKEGTPLKRLKNYLLRMENNTSTYKEMYEGEVIAYPANYPQQEEYKDHYHIFYHNENG